MLVWGVDLLIKLSNWVTSLDPSLRGPNKGGRSYAYARDEASPYVIGIIRHRWKLADER